MIRLTDPSQLAAELRRAWLSSGLTLAEIARRMGVGGPQEVSVWLAGRGAMHLATALRLAAALGYDLALIPREDTP